MNQTQSREIETRNETTRASAEPTPPRASSLKVKTTVKAGMGDACAVF